MSKQELMETLVYARDLAVEAETYEASFKKLERRFSIWRALWKSFLCFVLINIGFVFTYLISTVIFPTFAEIYLFLYIILQITILSFVVPFVLLMVRRHKSKIKYQEEYALYEVVMEKLLGIASIPDGLKYSNDLTTMYNYLSIGRTDTLKESVNLLLQEEREDNFHRETMNQLYAIQDDNARNARHISSQLSDIDVSIYRNRND
ncbi:hypothetical protein ANABIO32_23850 [Rossellomorea marisflavi]|uniref:hypothetical protein n=1 Tax=Rossellomorea marisflavi TaxID=189381 RepID=UPI0025C7BB54|nr:hypothetical protein [Rossellomorea marisflavi]GLI84674.1 hypothetical protein ANABIO32_23850 [Rossellomorea marisflavi]